MSNERGNEAGFTLIEVLVALVIAAVATSVFFSAVMSTRRSAEKSRSVIKMSEEARLAFNRIIRDTREGDVIDGATPTSYEINVDFDTDGDYENDPSTGTYENLAFSYRASDRTLRINGVVLMEGVEPIPGEEMFTFSSNFLAYDWNEDGLTTWQELDTAPTRGVTTVGNNNGRLDAGEYQFVSNVGIALRVRVGDKFSDLRSQAQLRNRR